jgi:hypothetical protein
MTRSGRWTSLTLKSSRSAPRRFQKDRATGPANDRVLVETLMVLPSAQGSDPHTTAAVESVMDNLAIYIRPLKGFRLKGHLIAVKLLQGLGNGACRL